VAMPGSTPSHVAPSHELLGRGVTTMVFRRSRRGYRRWSRQGGTKVPPGRPVAAVAAGSTMVRVSGGDPTGALSLTSMAKGPYLLWGPAAQTASMDPGSDGVHELTMEECYRLLATAQLGRLALSHRALPVVLPVSFLLHERTIVIQTTAGSVLDAAREVPVVAFETDDIDPRTYAGWSVVVTGLMRVVTNAKARSMFECSPAFPRITSEPRHFLTVTPRLVSGRRRLLIVGDPSPAGLAV
jgi:hypothetical protein